MPSCPGAEFPVVPGQSVQLSRAKCLVVPVEPAPMLKVIAWCRHECTSLILMAGVAGSVWSGRRRRRYCTFAPVTNPRQGQMYAAVVFGGECGGGANVGSRDVSWRAWLTDDSRTCSTQCGPVCCLSALLAAGHSPQPPRYIFYAGGSLAGAGYCRQCRRRPAILLLQGNM